MEYSGYYPEEDQEDPPQGLEGEYAEEFGFEEESPQGWFQMVRCVFLLRVRGFFSNNL
jgi:hypothetical protein